ncbi:MAG: diguanylate cyclase with sensor [Mycobacterium sp.]|jgi:two-component system cell cycle response regulator|nr:diguanylate cyclase with sensor [Mycobacterium sp.]
MTATPELARIAALEAENARLRRELRTTLALLEETRAELQLGLERIGTALQGLVDLRHTQKVVLETAMKAVQANAGVLYVLSPRGDTLVLQVGRGMDGRLALRDGKPFPLAVEAGGVLAAVARSGEPRAGRDLPLADLEPQGRDVLAVPLRTPGRAHGVLAVYDPSGQGPFRQRDLDVLGAFAANAAVALENVVLNEEARRQAITDGLTGLWNRRYLTMALRREVERAQRFSRPLAVLMLDLDRFKAVNDRFGHARGDAVLVETAKRIRRVIREVDVLARYGGEELVLLLPETDAAGGVQLAERVLAEIRREPFGEPGEEPLTVTVSCGVAAWEEARPGTAADEASADQLLARADAALYRAKGAGRDRVTLDGTLEQVS